MPGAISHAHLMPLIRSVFSRQPSTSNNQTQHTTFPSIRSNSRPQSQSSFGRTTLGRPYTQSPEDLDEQAIIRRIFELRTTVSALTNSERAATRRNRMLSQRLQTADLIDHILAADSPNLSVSLLDLANLDVDSDAISGSFDRDLTPDDVAWEQENSHLRELSGFLTNYADKNVSETMCEFAAIAHQVLVEALHEYLDENGEVKLEYVDLLPPNREEDDDEQNDVLYVIQELCVHLNAVEDVLNGQVPNAADEFMSSSQSHKPVSNGNTITLAR